MSKPDPEALREVVRRQLRGIPLDADLENLDPDQCRDCGGPVGSPHSGAQDGFCHDCAAERRRAGQWETRPMFTHLADEDEDQPTHPKGNQP